MNSSLGSQHYGRGTVVMGLFLLSLALIYMAQVAGVVWHTQQLLAHPLPNRAADDGMQFDLRTMAIYDFFFTSQAWGLAHLWLLWVAVLQVARHPQQRVQLVRRLAVVILAVVLVTWGMATWLGSHGTSV